MNTYNLPRTTDDEQSRRIIARALARHYSELEDAAYVRPDPKFSLGRALAAAAVPGGLAAGYEADLLRASAEAAGRAYDPHRLMVPMSLFRRDLTAVIPSAGGYMAGVSTPPLWEPLRGHSVVLNAGVTVLADQTSSLTVPVITGEPATTWHATEATQSAEGSVTLSSVAVTPKTVSAFVECSRQLLLQGTAADLTISGILLRAVGKALDEAVLTGTGASGQPLGLAGTTGIATASGTSLTWATMADLRATVTAAAGTDLNLSWLGGYTSQKLLSQREKVSSTGNMIWAGKSIDGDRAAVTRGAPAASLYFGDWSQCVVALFGSTLMIETDPFTEFKTGRVGMRCMLSADVAFMTPAAFGVASSIT